MADRFSIQYATEAIEDLGALRPFHRTAVRAAINQHLWHEPKRESRSRIKRMVQPFWSEFGLRVGDFRVYYDVKDAELVVRVLRVLEKGSGTTAQELP